jgi:hypothetical protein
MILLTSAFLSLLALPSATAITPPPTSDFSKFVDEYFEARYTFRPTEGTAQGFHQFDTKLPDLSRRSIDARIA